MGEVDFSDHCLPDESFYDGMLLTGSYKPSILQRIREMSFDGDIVCDGYPKTGTTWLQELVWIIYNDGAVSEAVNTPFFMRVPMIDIHPAGMDAVIDHVEKMPHPRILKSHLPASYYKRQLDTEDLKIVISIRNPKDMLVSYYHFYRANTGLGCFQGTWTDFFNLYLKKGLFPCDFFKWNEDWIIEMKNHPDKVLLVKYEDLAKSMKTEILKITEFFGKTLDDDLVNRIVEHCSFDSMKDNKNVNFALFPEFIKADISPFMRKGQVGDWKNYFTEEQSQIVDKRYEEWLDKTNMPLEFNQVVLS